MDQPAFNRAVVESEIEAAVLPNAYNHMTCASSSAPRDCRILHFFASNGEMPEYTLMGYLLKRLQETGELDWAAVCQSRAEGHAWRPSPEPWQLWQAGRYYQAIAAKVRQKLKLKPDQPRSPSP